MLFENDRYKVELPEGGDKYHVVNKTTGVVEYKESSLPRCIIICIEYDEVMTRLEKEQEAKAVEEAVSNGTNVRPLR